MSPPVSADMTIELAGRTFRLAGAPGPIGDAVGAALAANGGRPAGEAAIADLLIVSYPLLPDAGDGGPAPALQDSGRAMAEGAGGRIVFLLSAMAALPMRSHVDYSVAMAAAFAGVRALAMQLGPKVLVNAVGAGAIAANGALLAGDERMLTHASLGRAGAAEDIVNAVLFLCDPMNSYTTGQILNVDGGWTVGYGRNF
jgi:NAD(P)-dependent dehydrogenase (short-subunit alcohol dehydrogenase family)